MKKILKNKRGVAILLVLGAILVMSAIVTEFAYNSHVSYDVASSERDRLQSFYLAQSALNLVKLELKIERNLRNQFAGMLQNLHGEGSLTSNPLCKDYPLSSGGLKAMASGDISNSTGETSEASASPSESTSIGSDFLDFNGSFDASCDTEESRINLNIFRTDPNPLPGAPSLYDSQKDLLFSLLSQSEFEPLFDGKPDEIHKVVNAIADWVDRDDRVNEAPGVSGESEESAYKGSGDRSIKVKNGKYQTIGELHLVTGLSDELYEKLEPHVTIYGDSKLNLCQAPETLVKGFVARYIAATPGLAVISAKDDAQWSKVLAAVKLACEKPAPKPQEVAAAIGAVIGATDTSRLASQISTINRFYRLEVAGQVGESRSHIVEVIDAAAQNASLWKTLYFRVE